MRMTAMGVRLYLDACLGIAHSRATYALVLLASPVDELMDHVSAERGCGGGM